LRTPAAAMVNVGKNASLLEKRKSLKVEPPYKRILQNQFMVRFRV
jgi:hypothetical protein